jgi:hypothetical protein
VSNFTREERRIQIFEYEAVQKVLNKENPPPDVAMMRCIIATSGGGFYIILSFGTTPHSKIW